MEIEIVLKEKIKIKIIPILIKDIPTDNFTHWNWFGKEMVDRGWRKHLILTT